MESSTSADIQGFLMVRVHGSPVEDYCRALKGELTTRYYGFIIGDKSGEGA